MATPEELLAHERAMRLIAARRGDDVYDLETERVWEELWEDGDADARLASVQALVHQLTRIASTTIAQYATISVFDEAQIMMNLDAIVEDQ